MSLRTLPMAGGDQTPRRKIGAGVLVPAAFVATALAAFTAASILLVAWGADVTAPGGWAGPHAIALTHVVALGFVTSMALGVLYHLAPLAFGGRLRAPAAGLGVWAADAAGTCLLIVGLASNRSPLRAAGGCLLAVAVAAFATHLGTVVAGARRRYPPTMFQVAAVPALCVVAALGAVLAVMLDTGSGAGFLTILAAKIVLAVGGWLGLLIVGVSYQLVPMFTPTAVRARFLVPVLALLGGGVVTCAAAILAGLPPPVRVAAALVYLAGVTLHAADVVRMLRARRDPRVSAVTAGQAAGAAVLVAGTAAGVAAIADAGGPWPQLAVAAALAGWTPVLIASNAIRIVPFIVWQSLPPGRRPRTYGAAPPLLGWAGVIAALVAAVLLGVALASGSGLTARLAGAVLLVSAVSVGAAAAAGLRGLRGGAPR